MHDNKLINSPLRYPGSKYGLVKWFELFLEETGCRDVQLIEPYAGSAAMSLNLITRGSISSAVLFERDPLLFSFWHCVFNESESLLKLIDRFEPSLQTRSDLAWLTDLDDVHDDIALMGYAGLLFNRTSFSGVLHAGPIGGADQLSPYKVDCRFNKAELKRKISSLSELGARVQVKFGDAVTALSDASRESRSNRLFYIDPPYYVQGKRLYRYYYEFSDHVNLANTLRDASFDWVLSYDDHAVIRHLYQEFTLHEPTLRYSSKVPKNEQELIYTNVEGAAKRIAIAG